MVIMLGLLTAWYCMWNDESEPSACPCTGGFHSIVTTLVWILRQILTDEGATGTSELNADKHKGTQKSSLIGMLGLESTSKILQQGRIVICVYSLRANVPTHEISDAWSLQLS